MSRYYPTTLAQPLIGTRTSAGVLSPVTLEATYQTEAADKATKTFKVAGYPSLNLDFAYTIGATESSNSIEVILEGHDRVRTFFNRCRS